MRMKAIGLGGTRLAVIAVALVTAALAYVDAAGSSAGDEAREASQRSSRADEVEAAVARGNVTVKLEAALGDDFGGAWFEPSAARLHVGVTSSESQRDAEAVAARAGLAEAVVETPVDSTWEELEAAQDEWDHRLADLFDRQQVTTGLRAQYNAVEIELASSAPRARRAALEREAAAESVEVMVTSPLKERFRISPDVKRCRKFVVKSHMADCNPTLVGGVYIDDNKAGWVGCTAGPTVLRDDRTSKPKATDTFVLTAGHCIKDHGDIGGTWYAVNNKTPGEKDVIGKAVQYLNSETDVGVIEVTTKYWAEAKDPPLAPVIAWWDTKDESDPFPVVDQANPVEEETACHSGARTGTGCGTILKTGVTIKYKTGIELKNLTKVELENGAKAGNGDSGGPWFVYETPFNVAGTHASSEHEGGTEEGKIAYFQPLKVSFEKLKEKKSLGLELLKGKNQKRHGELKGGKYPVTLHGGTSGVEEFETEAGTVECTWSAYDAVVSEATSTVTVAPEYKECDAFGLVSATISMEGCAYVFHAGGKASSDNYDASADITCPAGKSIVVSAGTCKVAVPAQTGLESTDLIDDTGASPKKDITIRPTITGLAYTVTQDGFLCPFESTGHKTDGEYTNSANITITGQNPSSPSEKIDIEIADP